MTTVSGTGGVVKLTTNTVAEVKSWEIESAMRPIDDTALGDLWDSHLAGPQSWRGRVSANYDATDTNGQVALLIGASVTLNLYPEGTTTGKKFFAGTASVTRVMRNAARDTVIEVEFEFAGNGALSISTAP